MPKDFKDDGCSNAPDGFLLKVSKVRGLRWLRRFARSFWWCCKIHDWRYCGRCHAPGTMNQSARSFSDHELGWNIRGVLPFLLKWTGWVYFRVTSELGGRRAWNSCGPASGKRCRHNILMPDWMSGQMQKEGAHLRPPPPLHSE
jgi:hypothetical protein